MLNTTRPIVLGTVRTVRRSWAPDVCAFLAGFLVASAGRSDSWPTTILWTMCAGLLLLLGRRAECRRS